MFLIIFCIIIIIFLAIELNNRTNELIKLKKEKESRKNEVKYNFKVFAISMDRNKLYEKIEKRVDQMIEQGLVEEVKCIMKKYSHFPTAMQGLGYKICYCKWQSV